jgi:hypothetical protein
MTRFTTRICRVLPLVAMAAFGAEKKPVTIQNMPAPPRIPPITWAPDGKRFAWIEDRALYQYDVGAKKKKQLVALGALEEKAVKPPRQEGVDWQNRRVSEQAFQWSSTGQEMLIAVQGDLFLLHTGQMGATDGHRGRGARSEALARRPLRLVPAGARFVQPGDSVQESHAADHGQFRHALERRTGLGVPGRVEPVDGALVVPR